MRINCLPLLVSLLAVSGPALAQYKVVGPDGKVTYTDRAPVEGKIQAINPKTGAVANNPALPLNLREAAGRYPVTLYTGDNCAPCDAARKVLSTRGVPFSEKRVNNQEDIAALGKIIGAQEVPSLTVGSKVLRGYTDDEWQSYLDAASYPRTSQLPPGFQNGIVTPLTARAEAPVPVAPKAATRAEPSALPASGGFRF